MGTHMMALPTRTQTPQGDSCWHLGTSVSNFSLEQTEALKSCPRVSPDQPKKLHLDCRHCPGQTGQLWIWGFGSRCLLGAALPQQLSQCKILVKSVWAVLLLSWKTTFSGCDCQKTVQLELLYPICTRRTLFKSGDLGESKKGKKEGASSCEKRTELGEGPASVTKIWEHQTLEFFKIFIFRTLNLLIKTV